MTEQELINRLDTLPMEEKEAFIKETIKAHPDYLRFKNRLANLYINKEEFLKAKSLLEKELHQQYNIHLQITLGNLELKCNSLESASETIALLRKRNPKTPHGYILLGKLRKLEGNDISAINAFQEAHRVNPNLNGPVLHLQEIYNKKGRLQKAKSILTSGLKHNPTNYFFLMRLASTCLDLGEKEEARLYFEKAKLAANNETQAGNAALQLAVIEKDQLSEGEIISRLRQFSKQYPEHVGLRLNLIKYLSNAKSYQEALTEIAILKSIAPNDIRSIASKATIFHRQGLNEEAEDLCDQVLDKDPTQLNSLLLKANLLRLRDEAESAYLLYKKGIESHPLSPWPYAGMAQLLYQEGNLNDAITTLENGAKESNNIKPLKHKLIQFLMQSGEFNRALNLIKDYRKKSITSDLQISYLEMQLFQRKGNFEKAKTLAKDLLKDCAKDSVWEIRILNFLSATAYLEYDYSTAESILTDIVNRSDDSNMPRNRLALLYALKGKLQLAQQQLKIATKEIEEKETSGKVLIPLIGHTAKVLNEILINPRLKVKAAESFLYEGYERLEHLAKHNAEHPEYFGFSLYLSNELRSQGILEKLKDTLREQKIKPSIPKTIIQYWDSGTPPSSVEKIIQSWQELNPDYEYRLFSRKSAYYFLKFQLGRESAQAFLNCEHPAMQADFFRLAYLSKLGGFYADADDKCIKSLNTLVESGAELVLKLGDFGCISNNFLGAAPNNKIITDAYQKGVQNMMTYFNEGPWFRLGPGHLTKSVTYNLANYIKETDFRKWPKIYTLDQIETRQFISQHLSLPYKSSDKSWFTAEYKKTITKTKSKSA